MIGHMGEYMGEERDRGNKGAREKKGGGAYQ